MGRRAAGARHRGSSSGMFHLNLFFTFTNVLPQDCNYITPSPSCPRLPAASPPPPCRLASSRPHLAASLPQATQPPPALTRSSPQQRAADRSRGFSQRGRGLTNTRESSGSRVGAWGELGPPIPSSPSPAQPWPTRRHAQRPVGKPSLRAAATASLASPPPPAVRRAHRTCATVRPPLPLRLSRPDPARAHSRSTA